MSKKQKWFTLYEESAAASNLSIAGGAVKLVALLLMIAAIPCTLALLLAAARLTMASGMSTALIFVMDELDDLVFSAFFLWGGAVDVEIVLIGPFHGQGNLFFRCKLQKLSEELFFAQVAPVRGVGTDLLHLQLIHSDHHMDAPQLRRHLFRVFQVAGRVEAAVKSHRVHRGPVGGGAVSRQL